MSSVRGEPTVLAPKKVFDGWKARSPADPKEWIGIAKSGGSSIIVFHDPEPTRVLARGAGVLLVQTPFNNAKLDKHLKNIPSDGWSLLSGTYTSDGGTHLLFDAMYKPSHYELEDEDIDPPIEIKLAKGTYTLEYRAETWQPDKQNEIWLARLVPAT